MRALAIPVIVLALVVAVPAVERPVVAAGDPVIAAAGDIACDPADTHLNGGNGTGTYCMREGDLQPARGDGYCRRSAAGRQPVLLRQSRCVEGSYDATWGRVKSISHPVVGIHEYLTLGGTSPSTGCDSSNASAAGYYAYFGAAAGTAGQGWYSYDIGAWHLIALNSNAPPPAAAAPTRRRANGWRPTWRRTPISAYSPTGTSRSSAPAGGPAPTATTFWKQLYAAHADVVLDGDDHIYERFAPQTPDGACRPDERHHAVHGRHGRGEPHHYHRPSRPTA